MVNRLARKSARTIPRGSIVAHAGEFWRVLETSRGWIDLQKIASFNGHNWMFVESGEIVSLDDSSRLSVPTNRQNVFGPPIIGEVTD